MWRSPLEAMPKDDAAYSDQQQGGYLNPSAREQGYTLDEVLASMPSGAVLGVAEKPRWVAEWQAIQAEYPSISSEPLAVHSTYLAAYAALRDYLDTLPTWSDLSTATAITRTAWDGKWADYYAARSALFTRLERQALDDAADAGAAAATAQGTANGAATAASDAGTTAANAQAAANNAATAAANAQVAANAANAALADISADGKLTPVEKQSARLQWDTILGERAGIQARADAVSVSRTAYDSAFQALATYLNAGTAWSSGTPSWLADANLSTTTPIDGPTFRENWKSLFDARQAVLNAITAAAQAAANAAAAAAATAQQRAVDAESNAISAAAQDAANKVTAGVATAKAYTDQEVAIPKLKSRFVGTDALEAQNIMARAILAEHITLTGDSLIPNADFSSGDLRDWRPWNSGSLVSVLAAGATGVPASAPAAYVCQIDHAGARLGDSVSVFSHTKAYSDAGAETSGFPVMPGEELRVNVDAAKTAGWNPSASQVFVFWRLRDGDYSPHDLALTLAPTTSWATYSGSVTVPANAVRGWAYVYTAAATSGTPAGQLYFTNLTVRRKASAEMIVDGILSALLVKGEVIETPNYVPGSAGVPPVGVRAAGAPWTITLLDGTTILGNLELGEGASIAGHPALSYANLLRWRKVEFSTPGAWSWTVPTGVRRVRLAIVGGGSGGQGGQGGTPSTPGGGGNGGNPGGAIVVDLDVTPGQVLSGVIGARGLGGPAGYSGSTGTTGTAGANTTLVAAGRTWTARGGGLIPGGATGGFGSSKASGTASRVYDPLDGLLCAGDGATARFATGTSGAKNVAASSSTGGAPSFMAAGGPGGPGATANALDGSAGLAGSRGSGGGGGGGGGGYSTSTYGGVGGPGGDGYVVIEY